MSITALTWAMLYGAALIASFANPLFGALGYLLEYYMRPQLKWWGKDLPSLRYNLIISAVLGLAFVLRRTGLRPMAAVTNNVVRWLFALGVLMVIVTLTIAVNRGISWNWTLQWWKIAVIFPMLLVGVLRTRGAFDAFVSMNMLGAFWWGYQAWVHPKRAEGRLMDIGSGDSLDDNAAAAHLLTVLPFVVLYLLTVKDKRLRAIALITLPFLVNTLILCNSRGAMVALLAAVAAAMFLVRSGYRLRLVGAAIGLLAAVLMLADTTFIRRQQTTAEYQEDGSAQQRLATWQAGARLVWDRPLGSGGRGFHLLSPEYIPDIVESHGGDPRAPHNTWVMVPAEWGVLGLVCYIGIYVSVFRTLRRIKKRAGTGFYYWRALAIQLALVATIVASAFTDRLYGESGYWMIGLACALERLQLTECQEGATTQEAVAAGAIAARQTFAHA